MAAVREDDAEVVVVGAGPAGAAAAYWLAQAGVDVLVVRMEPARARKVILFGLLAGALFTAGGPSDVPGAVPVQRHALEPTPPVYCQVTLTPVCGAE